MNSWLKKAFASAVVLASVSAIAAAVLTRDEVNEKIALIVAPYNTQTTKVSLELTDLKFDTVRTLDFGLAASVWKKGTANELNLDISHLEYHYGDGTSPSFTVNASVGLDLVKAVGQEALNYAAKDISEMAQQAADEFGKEYGDAVVVNAAVDELVNDENGNAVSAKMHIVANIDFAKLPAAVKAEDVEFKAISLQIGASRTGMNVNVQVTLNPLNKGFDTAQPGLKEIMEKLVNDDKKTYDDVKSIADTLNSLAEMIVNPQPQAQP